eukprot:7872110-Pyramimonas_sp.AAC.1
MSVVRQSPQGDSGQPWARLDLPLGPRTAESALFAFKRMLLQWGYGKKVEVDTGSRVLKVAGEDIFTVVRSSPP